ncbi:MAG: hypothetical protein Q9220_002445 [cf. Caloplaca sp. 1 TL-2023]
MAATQGLNTQAYDAFGDPYYDLSSSPTNDHHYGSDNRYTHYSVGNAEMMHEINILRTRLFYLEPLLAEREKEIIETRGTINVLLTLLARKNSSGPCDCACVWQAQPNQRKDGENNEILLKILEAIQSLAASSTLTHCYPLKPGVHTDRPQQDLLDFSEELSDSDVRGADAREFSGSVSANIIDAGLIETAERLGRVVCPLKQAVVEETHSHESNGPSLAPYVTRFARTSAQETTNVETQGKGHSEVCISSPRSMPQYTYTPKISPKTAIEDVQLLESLNESICSNAEDSLGDDSSENASTGPTSVNSSFATSDAEPEAIADSSAQESARGKACRVSNSCVQKVHSQKIPPCETVEQFRNHSDPSTLPPINLETFFMPHWSQGTTRMPPAECSTAISLHKMSLPYGFEGKLPEFFKYGIRYCPCPTELNIHRTVILDHLPRGITLSTLLENVRGGVLVDAKLLDTAKITGYKSALITFVYGYAARSFVDKARQKPLEFEGIRARLVLLPTPTFPMSKSLYISITGQSHTRCLRISNFPRHIKPSDLERDLHVRPSMRIHGIEAKMMGPDNVLDLRFTSVKYAEIAYGTLCNLPQYKQCTFKHSPDPCLRPWEDTSDKNVEMMDKQTPVQERPILKVPEVEAPPAMKSWQSFVHNGVATSSTTLGEIAHSSFGPEEVGRLDEKPNNSDAIIQRGRGFGAMPPFQTTGEICTTH